MWLLILPLRISPEVSSLLWLLGSFLWLYVVLTLVSAARENALTIWRLSCGTPKKPSTLSPFTPRTYEALRAAPAAACDGMASPERLAELRGQKAQPLAKNHE